MGGVILDVLESTLMHSADPTHTYISSFGCGKYSYTAIFRSLFRPTGGIRISSPIRKASLTLTIDTDYCTNPFSVEVCALKRKWVRGQATHNIFSTGNNWQTAGAYGALDFDTTTIGSKAVGATEAVGSQIVIPLDPALMTNYFALYSDYGLLLRGSLESTSATCYMFKRFDDATYLYRPKLEIIFGGTILVT